MSDSPEYLQLWQDYATSRSVRLRNQIVLHHRGIAQKMAHRAAIDALSETHQDLEQIAMFGLIKAVEKFDLSKYDQSIGCLYKLFGSWAGGWCRGEILHYLRDKSTIKIPRGWRDFYSQVRKARKNGITDLEEIAKVTSTTPEFIEKVERAFTCLHTVKLDFHDHELEIEFESPIKTELPPSDDLEHHWQEIADRFGAMPAMEREALVGLFIQQRPKTKLMKQLMVCSEWQLNQVVTNAFKVLLGDVPDRDGMQLSLFE